MGVADLERVGRIVRGIGGDVNGATAPQPGDQQIEKIGADQAAGALALLRPRIRKEDPDAGERVHRDAADEVDHVALDHPDVAKPASLDRLENGGNARRMHIDADHVFIRSQLGELDQCLATSEADVEDDIGVRLADSEHLVE